MTVLRTVKVAAVQAPPVILDAAGSAETATALIGAAAGEGAEVVVLPETSVSLIPSQGRAAASFSATEAPGPKVDRIAAARRFDSVGHPSRSDVLAPEA